MSWRVLLDRARTPRVALGFALAAIVVLNAPSLSLGWFGDDYVHRRLALAQLSESQPQRAFWNLFDDRGSERGLLGQLPWWTSEEFSFALLRPLTAASHLLDYALWPESPLWMHVHNLVLLGLIAVIAADLYRRWLAGLGTGLAAWLALALYVIDDAQTIGAAWIASRSMLLGTSFALAVVWLHDAHQRDRRSWAGWVAPVALVCAHASTELTIAVWAYLVAYAVYLNPRGWGARLIALAPLAAVSCGWFAWSAASGYGVRGSGMFIDPRLDPQRFFASGLARLPDVVQLQLGVPAGALAQLIASGQRTGALLSHLFVVLALVIGLRPVWRTPATKFFLVGTVLALVPLCALGALERLMFLSGFGAHGLLGIALASCIAQVRSAAGARKLAPAVIAAGLFVVHVVLAVALPPRGLEFARAVHRHVANAARSLPSGAELEGRVLVVLNYPDYLTSIFVEEYRDALERRGAKELVWIGTSPTPVRVGRTAADEFELEPVGGYMNDLTMWLVRSPRAPFEIGRAHTLSRGASVRVQALAPDGRPDRIALHAKLDDPRWVWLAWDFKQRKFRRVELPAVGFSRWLPSTIE